MLGKHQNVRKEVNFEAFTNNTHETGGINSTRDIGPKTVGQVNKENRLQFKIPMSYVLSRAENVCLDEKHTQQFERFQKSCKIDEFCKDILQKSIKSTLDDTVPKRSSGRQVWTPNYRRITERCSPLQEDSIKRARKQAVSSYIEGRIPAARRRPLTTSNQQVWFMNKDTTSAILSSKTIAKKFKSMSKVPKKPEFNQVMKKTSTRTELVNKVPKFTAIPNEYQNLCRNKSVGEVLDIECWGKTYGELHKTLSKNGNKRISPVSISQTGRHPGHQWKHKMEETKPTMINTQATDACRRKPYAQFSRPTTRNETLQVPKNIYIRKTSRSETMEDLVEVRNQDDLDVLNTIATLQLIDSSKHGSSTTSGKCFKDLRDYEVYYYPCQSTESSA